MFRKILVPLDGTALSERALAPALDLAAETNGEIILLTAPVYTDLLVTSSAAYGVAMPTYEVAEMQENSAEYLNAIQKSRCCSNIPVHIRVVERPPCEAIVETAANEKCDLIVMSTHARTGVSRWLFGSVTDDVLHQAPCPVLVIRE